MKNTAISWTNDTINLWAGCTKVSDACKFCYAAEDTARKGFVEWGPKATRRVVKSAWDNALSSERAASKLGAVSVSGVPGRRLVFVNSWSDFFEDRPEVAEVRTRFYEETLIDDFAVAHSKSVVLAHADTIWRRAAALHHLLQRYRRAVRDATKPVDHDASDDDIPF